MRFSSAYSGSQIVGSFAIEPANLYRWSWANSGNSALEYHNGLKLSTIDADHSSSSCASTAQSFGWFNGCCDLCMTANASGTWRSGGGALPWQPVDWNYKGTDWLRFWGK
jgi:hypothetical protein